MKFSGFEIKNYRSIGNEPLIIHPLHKINILVGQNNVGKSNIIRCINEISNWSHGKELKFSELDMHKRELINPISIRLYFENEENDADDKFRAKYGNLEIWYEFNWSPSLNIRIVNDYFSNIEDFNLANTLLKHYTGSSWSTQVDKRSIRKGFQDRLNDIFQKIKPLIPEVLVIPEFRRISEKEGESYHVDGQNLIKLLAEYRTPDIGREQDREKFEKIEKSIKKLLNLSNLNLEIPSGLKNLLIDKEGLRLPLENYGTGVHELLILLAAFSFSNKRLYCIEEPEIHLHPRLQNKLLQFLIQETSHMYLISSHSPAIINFSYHTNDVKVILMKNENGLTISKILEKSKDSIDALHDLGYKPSDLLQSNCIIWVEGPSDETYIERWINLLAPDLINGQDYVFLYYCQYSNIGIEEPGQSPNLINIIEINHNAIYIADSDKKNPEDTIDQVKETLKNKCEEHGGFGWITDGREIENYIPFEVLSSFLNEVRNCEIIDSMGAFEKINDYFNKQTNTCTVKPLNYEHCKKEYSKKISEHFSIKNIQGDLKSQMDKLIEKIRKWKE